MAESSRNQLAREQRRGGAGWVDVRLLTLVAGSVKRQMDTALASEGFSAEQWRVLDYLDETAPCTMSTLAHATGTSGATLTRTVDRLVSRALVYRSADRGDRRRVLVHLSERGQKTTRRVRPLIVAAEERSAAQLSADERDELMRLLRLMSPVENSY